MPDNNHKSDKRDKKDTMGGMLGFLGLGFSVSIAIIVGFLAGWYLDRLTGLFPLFTVVFLLLAIVGSFYKAYKDIMKMY